MNPITVRDAIKSPSPAIAFLFQDSPTKAKAILALLVADLVKFFNVGKSMNDFQIGQTINLIFEDEQLKSLKPDDFKLCFTRMKKGYNGVMYDRIDGQIIIGVLNEYLHERVLECEEISFKQHNSHLEDDRTTPANPEGQKKVIEILSSVIKNTVKVVPVEVEKPVKKAIQKSERDLFIQKCISEHYNIWLKNPYKAPPKPKSEYGLIDNENTGGRYIEFNGTGVSDIEYTQIKLKEYDSL